MAPAEGDPKAAVLSVNIEVELSPGPRQVQLVVLALPPGATVRDALKASGLVNSPGDDAALGQLHVGIWGRKAALDTALREGDRVECYRGLKVDPKEARRTRYRAHGEKLPKGIHRPRDRVADMTQAPEQRRNDPAD